MDYKSELLRSIQIMIDKKLRTYKSDRTYESVVEEITPKGYVVLDEAGCKRTVKCALPNLQLSAGQRVWIKEPMGNLRKLHICGVVK